MARLQRSGGEPASWQGWQGWRADPPALQLRARDLAAAAFPEQSRSGLPLLDLTGGEGVATPRPLVRVVGCRAGEATVAGQKCLVGFARGLGPAQGGVQGLCHDRSFAEWGAATTAHQQPEAPS